MAVLQTHCVLLSPCTPYFLPPSSASCMTAGRGLKLKNTGFRSRLGTTYINKSRAASQVGWVGIFQKWLGAGVSLTGKHFHAWAGSGLPGVLQGTKEKGHGSAQEQAGKSPLPHLGRQASSNTENIQVQNTHTALSVCDNSSSCCCSHFALLKAGLFLCLSVNPSTISEAGMSGGCLTSLSNQSRSRAALCWGRHGGWGGTLVPSPFAAGLEWWGRKQDYPLNYLGTPAPCP